MEHVEKEVDGWVVKTSNSECFNGKNLVIATGMNNRLAYPSWASELISARPNQVGHVFAESLPQMKPPFVVIGGGISAAHLVIKLSKEFLVRSIKSQDILIE